MDATKLARQLVSMEQDGGYRKVFVAGVRVKSYQPRDEVAAEKMVGELQMSLARRIGEVMAAAT